MGQLYLLTVQKKRKKQLCNFLQRSTAVYFLFQVSQRFCKFKSKIEELKTLLYDLALILRTPKKLANTNVQSFN